MNTITTRNLHEHTAQEVFDFVCTKLLLQGCQSTKFQGCVYRGPDNTKRAVGHIILDDDYVAVLDETGEEIGSLAAFSGDVQQALGWVDDAHFELLTRLQQAHDGAGFNFTKQFEMGATKVAEKFGLNTNVLTEFKNGND